MSIDVKTYEKITGDAELMAKLEGLWRENAPAEQLAQMLKDAGIDVTAGQVEEFLTQQQAKRVDAIALDEVDEEQLKKVAGGASDEGSGAVCDDSFFCYQNIYDQCTADLYTACDAYTACAL